MAKKRSKPEIERFIFDEFRKVCSLAFSNRESRPEPEPDILATLDSGEQIAFELTQVDDSKVLEDESIEFQLTEQLQELRSELIGADDLRGFSFHVHFFNQKFGQQRKLLPRVIELINQHRPPSSSIAIREKGHLVGKITAHNHKCDIEVQLGLGTGSNVGDYTLERINTKIYEKTYVTTHPIHLLAWGVTMWPTEKWEADVVKAACSQSKFDRIWVFNYGQGHVFSPPASSP